MINSKDISVVVQGPISGEITLKCIKSIRQFLPDAEIILSTWKNEDISQLDYDKLVLCDDPGATLLCVRHEKQIYNNMNRQLVTTKEGLKLANRKYILKFRTDLVLTNANFLDFWNKFQCRSNEYLLFKHKIIVPTLFSRIKIDIEKRTWLETPFHVSDWWFFGLNEDIKTFFLDTEIVEEPYFTQYFSDEKNINKNNPYGKAKHRFSPEQYFTYSCFARNFKDIKMEDAADLNDEIIEKSRKCIINNFIILEYKQSGIYLPKYPFSKNEKCSGNQYLGLYNFNKFEKEYKKYCDFSYQLTNGNKSKEEEKLENSLLRLQKHFYRIFYENSPLSKKFEQIFLGVPISFVSFIFSFLKYKVFKI